jgi:hypothetical protein
MTRNNLCIISISLGQTIHPIEKYISLILFKIPSIVTWLQQFSTSKVMEAVRGQKTFLRGPKKHEGVNFLKK